MLTISGRAVVIVAEQYLGQAVVLAADSWYKWACHFSDRKYVQRRTRNIETDYAFYSISIINTWVSLALLFSRPQLCQSTQL